MHKEFFYSMVIGPGTEWPPQPMKSVKIRYNTNTTSEKDRWKLLIDNEIHIVSHVVFLCPVETSVDWTEETGDYRAHISCNAKNIDIKTSSSGFIEVTVK